MIDASSADFLPPKIILGAADLGQHDFNESVEELKELVRTAGGEFLGILTQKRPALDNLSVLGKGKILELKEMIEEVGADAVIFDNELTPVQIRHLEDVLDCLVTDRTTLILDIFARRAMTKSGKIQVESAQLKYLLPRLTGKHKELSRLAGGIGTRGPGESQLESDRRHLRRRIAQLDSELRQLEKSRNLITDRRKKDGKKIVALVGYTNAGKSTLLNALSSAEVLVEDKLFATLDPTARKVVLRGGLEFLLIDTVGFIRNLPHGIVDAFKSTLAEAVNADLLLHVADVSAPDFERRREIVESTLSEIGANAPQIMVCNKIDLVDNLPENESLIRKDTVHISAKNNFGLNLLLAKIGQMLTRDWVERTIEIPFSDGALLAYLRRNAEIMDCTEGVDGYNVTFRAGINLQIPNK